MYNSTTKFVVWEEIYYDRLNERMHDHYIKPNIESQPKDDAEDMWFDLLNNELSPQMRKTLQKALSFYAVQSFRLGVRTGVTLNGEL